MNTLHSINSNMLQWQLKVVMAKRDISAKELARQTGMGYSTVIKLRNNPPSRIEMDSLNKLCRALNCHVGELIEFIPDNEAA